MAYLIHNISDFIPEEEPMYFCDANVWIAALNYYGIGTGPGIEQPYIDFVLSIINLNEITDPHALKKIKIKPKLVLSSLLLSEIINAYMRKVAMKAFFGGGDNYKKHDFKKEYRDDPNTDFKKQLASLCHDIECFKDYTVVYDDDFINVDPYSLLPIMNFCYADFNDVYYHKFLSNKNIPFVTNDKDFKFQDVKIITANPKLLKYSSIADGA